MGFKKFAKKSSATRFFREPIAVLGRFPFEQRSSPPRSAAQQHWPGPLSLPPLERGPGHFSLWYDNKVKNHDEFSRNHTGIDGKLSGSCLDRTRFLMGKSVFVHLILGGRRSITK